MCNLWQVGTRLGGGSPEKELGKREFWKDNDSEAKGTIVYTTEVIRILSCGTDNGKYRYFTGCTNWEVQGGICYFPSIKFLSYLRLPECEDLEQESCSLERALLHKISLRPWELQHMSTAGLHKCPQHISQSLMAFVAPKDYEM
jgi:hypothetical protein